MEPVKAEGGRDVEAVRHSPLQAERLGPVGEYWKEYASHGKGDTTLRQILTHRAGLPAFPRSAKDVDLLDDDALRRSLESAPPEFAPGSGLAEHALTYGHLIDGALRAGTGRSLEQIYKEVVRPTLGIDAWFGVPENELHRVADVEHALPGGSDHVVAYVTRRLHDHARVAEMAIGLGDDINMEVACQ